MEHQTKDYILNVTDQISDLKETIADDFGNDFVNYCIVIICTGAILFIGTKIIKCLLKGSPIDLETLIIPFLFIFIISAYRPATRFVDFTTHGFEYLIASKCANIDGELNALRDQKIELSKKINEKIYEQQLENADGWFEEIWVEFKALWRDFIDLINIDKLVSYFFLLLMFISAFLIRVVGGILTILLYLIGPFSIAVSAIPAFKDTWKTWLSTYIWVQLFSPVAQLVGYVLANLEKSSLQIDIARLEQLYTQYAENFSEPVPETFYSGLTYLAFMAAGVLMYWCVPTIAGWIVPAQSGSTLSVLTAFASKLFATGVTQGGKAGRNLGKQGGKILKKVFSKKNGNGVT